MLNIINFISPIGSQHKTKTQQLKHSSNKQNQLINQYNQSVTTRRVSARLSMRKIGEHLTRHIAGLNNFFWRTLLTIFLL